LHLSPEHLFMLAQYTQAELLARAEHDAPAFATPHPPAQPLWRLLSLRVRRLLRREPGPLASTDRPTAPVAVDPSI
jgi:hypothetical protein